MPRQADKRPRRNKAETKCARAHPARLRRISSREIKSCNALRGGSGWRTTRNRFIFHSQRRNKSALAKQKCTGRVNVSFFSRSKSNRKHRRPSVRREARAVFFFQKPSFNAVSCHVFGSVHVRFRVGTRAFSTRSNRRRGDIKRAIGGRDRNNDFTTRRPLSVTREKS